MRFGAWGVRLGLACALVLLLCGAMEAQQPPGAPQGEATGILTGRVESLKHRGLSGATVRLASGQSTVTDASGAFRFDGVPPGDYTIQVSCRGYKPASGKVHIEAGQTRSLLVGLKGDGSGTGQGSSKRANFSVEAYAVSDGHARSWVSRIEVWEYGNARRHWMNYWWTDDGYPYRSLSCPGGREGKYYDIAITWTVGKGYRTRRTTFQKRIWSDGQVERFYHP